MATVIIPDLDDAIVDRLEVQAQLNNRSLEAELRRILDNASEPMADSGSRAVAERIAAMSLGPLYEDSAEAIYADR
ncbi:MAG TPA: plasmid stabilization protein [Alphaproteobacteria bacterium]|nr:plasmid stabilization protein [Alphaproteobacteria bacterium]